MRTGLFATELVKRGHHITWWTSGFDHTHKKVCSRVDSIRDMGEHYRIRLIACPPYYRNVGLRRIINHRFVAKRFAALAGETDCPPDVVVCSYPTIELSLQAVRYGRGAGVPVILDVRDLWPDVFLDLLPSPLRPVGKFALLPLFREAREALQGASGIIATTAGYLSWAVRMAGRNRGLNQVFPIGYPTWLEDTEPTTATSEVLAPVIGRAGVFVCFFGTIGRQFDLETVIRAAKLLQDAGVTFVLCGTGERLEHLRRSARTMKNVLLPGHINYSEIKAIMKRCAIGLAPYRVCENFNLNVPNKIYEYLSGGLPILSPLEGEVRSLFESEGVGIHYPEGDATALAKCIVDLKDEPQELARMSMAAERLFKEKYRSELINEAMAEYVEGFIGSGRTGSK